MPITSYDNMLLPMAMQIHRENLGQRSPRLRNNGSHLYFLGFFTAFFNTKIYSFESFRFPDWYSRIYINA